MPGADAVEYVILPVNMDEAAQKVWNAEKARFHVVDDNGWWVVYQRN